MKRAVPLLLLICLIVATPTPADAVVIYIKDRDDPIFGFFVREDDTNVVIHQMQNGRPRRQVIPRATIERVLYSFDAKRLEALDYGNAEAYRRYAEELAEKPKDPEARSTAIRLFLCAAHLDPEKQGRGSMLGLIALARNDLEESKFRAMTYLLDPEHDQRVLTRPDPVKVRPTGVGEQARGRLLKAMRMIRSGRGVAAKQVLDYADVQSAFEFFKELISAEEFARACTETDVPPPLLEKLVKLELALLPTSGADTRMPTTSAEVSWRKAIRRDGLAPVPVLSLENLTEFDPLECHYRDGKWVRPE